MSSNNTYCQISRTTINIGETCVLIPLGFCMQQNFDKWNKADITHFCELYTFIGEPQLVIWGGNYFDITYLNKHYENTLKYELFMIISKETYDTILSKYECYPDISYHSQIRYIYDWYVKGGDCEQWVKDVYKIMLFMRKVGLQPQPHLGIVVSGNSHSHDIYMSLLEGTVNQYKSKVSDNQDCFS